MKPAQDRKSASTCGYELHERHSIGDMPLAGLVLGGDLNPISGLCFPLFSMAFPREIAIRVESRGFSQKKKCGLLWSIYVQIFYVF
jgi:hypothetical protein